MVLIQLGMDHSETLALAHHIRGSAQAYTLQQLHRSPVSAHEVSWCGKKTNSVQRADQAGAGNPTRPQAARKPLPRFSIPAVNDEDWPEDLHARPHHHSRWAKNKWHWLAGSLTAAVTMAIVIYLVVWAALRWQ